MEFLRDISGRTAIKTAIFDFDGTISTLRANWEEIMEELMLELIHPLEQGEDYPDELIKTIREYIAESTGIQTAYQMQWLKETVESYGKNDIVEDIWWYKDRYNEKLIEMVNNRIDKLTSGTLEKEDYRINGSLEFVKALFEKGVAVYIASGTDHDDLVNEIDILGLSPYIIEAKGAPERQLSCSKEKVLEDLLELFSPQEVAVFGDGKVEIELGHKAGTLTVGTATDEKDGKKVNPVKRERLINAGADIIVGDFEDKEGLLKIMSVL